MIDPKKRAITFQEKIVKKYIYKKENGLLNNFKYWLASLSLFLFLLFYALVFYYLEYGFNFLDKYDFYIYGKGIVEEINYDCKIPYNRCYIKIKNIDTNETNFLIFDSYDRYMDEAISQKTCAKYLTIPENLSGGSVIEFGARGPMQYREMGNNKNYELCADYTKENKEIFIKKL